MRNAIEADRQARLWARDWRLALNWWAMSESGLTLSAFMERHIDPDDEPSTYRKPVERLEARIGRARAGTK